jgi:hypothetical protein
MRKGCRLHAPIGLTAQGMFDLYQSKVTSAGDDRANGEKVTISFIEKAFLVWDRALRHREIQDVVLQEEADRQRSMYNSVWGMSTLVTKAKTYDAIFWVFASIRDGKVAGFLSPDVMSTRSLEGKVAGSNGKGLVDLLLYKKTMLGHLLTTWLPSKTSVPKEVREKVQEVCQSHQSFRRHLGFKGGSLPDLQWKAGWAASSDAVLSFVEDSHQVDPLMMFVAMFLAVLKFCVCYAIRSMALS